MLHSAFNPVADGSDTRSAAIYEETLRCRAIRQEVLKTITSQEDRPQSRTPKYIGVIAAKRGETSEMLIARTQKELNDGFESPRAGISGYLYHEVNQENPGMFTIVGNLQEEIKALEDKNITNKANTFTFRKAENDVQIATPLLG